MTATNTAEVDLEVTIQARPETVFSFLVDPAKMTRWMGSMAELDPRPGGIFHVAIVRGSTARGEYLVVEPFTRVVLTWGWEQPEMLLAPGASTLEILLTPIGDTTVLRLVHRGLPEPARDQFLQGWNHFLARLAVVAAGGDPGIDPLTM